MATKKTSPSTKGKGKVRKVMHEYKEGELKSGSGRKVTNRKQAVAIALNEAREAGARIPAKKKAVKKAASKKAAAKKTAAKKTATRKTAVKKTAAKKTAAKKTARKRGA